MRPRDVKSRAYWTERGRLGDSNSEAGTASLAWTAQLHFQRGR